MGGRRLLVDPLLSEPGALPAVRDSPDGPRNPLVPLPVDPARVIAGVEAILVTHLQVDHFDPAAAKVLPRSVPVLCQPADLDALAEWGFEDVRPVHSLTEWRGLRIVRTGAGHATGEVGDPMGPVSGWVLSTRHEPVLYLAGDTVWAPEVEEALAEHHPRVAVVSSGAARVGEGGRVTMDVDDLLRTAEAARGTTLVAVHMDAVTDCGLGRAELRAALAELGLEGRVLVPEDGEALDFGARQE